MSIYSQLQVYKQKPWQVIIDTLCRNKSGGRAAVLQMPAWVVGRVGPCQKSDSLGAQHCQRQRWIALFCVPDCICAPCHQGVTCQNRRGAPFLMLMPCNDSFWIPGAVLALNKSRCDRYYSPLSLSFYSQVFYSQWEGCHASPNKTTETDSHNLFDASRDKSPWSRLDNWLMVETFFL